MQTIYLTMGANITGSQVLSFLPLLDVIRLWTRDFPGGPVVKNPPCNAGDASSTPDQETTIPHAAGQLSPRATTRGKPAHPAMKDPTCCNQDLMQPIN